MKRLTYCSDCNGFGMVWIAPQHPRDWKQCDSCNGSGIRVEDWNMN